MRTLAHVRNYCLLVFFIVLVGGVLLQPGNHEHEPASQAVTAGFAP